MPTLRAQPPPGPAPITNNYLYPGNDLGAVYTPQATTIKLWAPTAKTVSIELFADPTNAAASAIPMSVDSNGIWSATLPGDLDGKYYLYEVTLPVESGRTRRVQVNDPCACGCSSNSGRTLIYDPAKTNPDGWDQDQFVSLEHNVDAVLYEVHLRDFTVSPTSGVSPANRAKYLGMVETGTKTPDGLASGLDHLQELGITHVHLLPVGDFASSDDREKADAYTWYNWGYDPVLYNTPAGCYASDPNGTARQKELKRMVQEFHRHNIGVVMDVVFNHTAARGFSRFSIFDKVYPRYYYRQSADGGYSNATGCGNELASERPMVRKFIVDSIKYWMTEYHIDGFRFDLMGILDRDTMLEVYREAKKINPSAILYGEGWQMEGVLPPDRMMTQFNVQNTGIAAFNDGIRDNIKGDAGDGPSPGFVQGAGAPYGGMDRLWLNVKGQSTGRGDISIPVATPNESINYCSVHDDHCLRDKLLLSAADAPDELRIRMDKLAAGMVLTAQGVPFIRAGDELLQSKNLVKNSYNDNRPNVNPIDWRLKAQHADVFNFYRGLIALRKAHPAFRMTDKAKADQSLERLPNAPDKVMAYLIKNHANGDGWNDILVVYNGNREAREVNVPGNWVIVANHERAGTVAIATVHENVPVEGCSLVVAHD